MRNIKLPKWLVGLVSVFALTLVSACGDKVKGSKTLDPSSAAEVKTIKVHKWQQVKSDKNFKPTNNKIDATAISGDDKSFYVIANGGTELFLANLNKKFDNLFNDANWQKIELGTTGLDGAAGKAAMATAVHAIGLVPTKTGVLVERSVATRIADAVNGVAFLSGATWMAAWSYEDTPRHFPQDAVTNNSLVTAAVVTKGGGEYPIIFQHGAKFGYSDAATINFTPAALTKTVKSHTSNDFLGVPHVKMFKKDALIVDERGVHMLKEAVIAGAADWTTDAAVTAASANVGSDGWRFTGKGPNNIVNAIEISGSNLFIALKATGPDTGGVAVVDLKKPSVKPPDAAWNNINVLALAVDSVGRVWAVTAEGLFEARVDGKRGNALVTKEVPAKFADLKDGGTYDENKELLPTSNITGARFFGDDLIIATSDKGLIARRMAEIQKERASSK